MILEAKINSDFMIINVGEIRYVLIRRGLDIQRFEETMFNALIQEDENLQIERFKRNNEFPKIIHR
jgi:hypothetical protein